MERVSLIEGDTPVLIVAPHGSDDTNTDYIAETVAAEFGAYAVINRGFKRSQTVDYWKDLANCNDVRHLHHDVVKEEFLDPILRFAKRIELKYGERPFVLILHGCSDIVRQIANDEDLDLIVGYGNGDPPSYSCTSRFKNAFVCNLRNEGFGVYEGRSGGNYAGRSKNNLNQLFNHWYQDFDVESIQLEIVREMRCDDDFVQLAINGLISAIDAQMLLDDTVQYDSNETKKI
jgi:hypothetical protein